MWIGDDDAIEVNIGCSLVHVSYTSPLIFLCGRCVFILELTTFSLFFFFNDTATTEIYTLSLHDALPICRRPRSPSTRRGSARASRRAASIRVAPPARAPLPAASSHRGCGRSAAHPRGGEIGRAHV